MVMTLDGKYLYAGQNEFYKWGHKAQEAVSKALTPNEQGFYRIPTCTKYFAFGTSEGKYGEFAKWHDTFFSVNKAGYLWAKVGTPKAEAFVEMINDLINSMTKMHNED